MKKTFSRIKNRQKGRKGDRETEGDRTERR